MAIFISSLIIIVYLFFSIVATKMASYPIIVFPFICLCIGFLINYSSNQFKSIRNKRIVSTITLVTICVSMFSYETLYLNHIKGRKQNKENLVGEFKELKMIESLDEHLNNENYILFNNSITPYGHVATMFYTDYESYSFIPSKEQVLYLKNNGCKIACLKTENLPIYIIEDKSILLVPIPSN